MPIATKLIPHVQKEMIAAVRMSRPKPLPVAIGPHGEQIVSLPQDPLDGTEVVIVGNSATIRYPIQESPGQLRPESKTMSNDKIKKGDMFTTGSHTLKTLTITEVSKSGATYKGTVKLVGSTSEPTNKAGRVSALIDDPAWRKGSK